MNRLFHRMFDYTPQLTVDAWGATPEEADLRADNLPSMVEKYRPFSPEAHEWMTLAPPVFSKTSNTPTSFTLHIALKVAIKASSQEQANGRLQALVRDFAEYVSHLPNVSTVSLDRAS